MTTQFFADTAVLQGRSLRHILRSPDTIITTTIMPIAFMLPFVYVFGGAIETGSDSYVSYLLPGILLITIASGISYTAFRLFLDIQSGIFERFQSMPIARSSVLWAHVGTSLVANPGHHRRGGPGPLGRGRRRGGSSPDQSALS
jgi:ABC-2 type transport system permease protein